MARIRIGVLASAGGSAFLAAAAATPHVEFSVVTDRECPVELACRERQIPLTRIVEPDRQAFSRQACNVLQSGAGCDAVVMLFSRLVSEPLLSGHCLLNIHPSLLPAFPGIGAVAAARRSGVRFLGATLHAATAEMDAGPILAQACQPVDPGLTAEQFEHLSFLHKTALFLLAIELVEQRALVGHGAETRLASARPAGERLNPMLVTPSYVEAVRQLQQRNLRFFE